MFYCSIYNPKIIQISLKSILSGKAGVHKEAFFAIPFFEAAIVEQLQVVLNDERHDVMLQALLKEDQAAYTAISVLEGMDSFKGYIALITEPRISYPLTKVSSFTTKLSPVARRIVTV